MKEDDSYEVHSNTRLFFLLDENHYVYDHVENEDSLHIYIKSKEHGCKCPICGK